MAARRSPSLSALVFPLTQNADIRPRSDVLTSNDSSTPLRRVQYVFARYAPMNSRRIRATTFPPIALMTIASRQLQPVAFCRL
ncbi:hypothetical protein BDV98DRAFT_260595 [Pterulicium gracile]|uniref:Uncharacterized protein n=1 Tax=Pterulicium gracile TaxID=1884261 RepID=A0A5C3Q6J1_9AGAR|nr:hypothetical protein BDV98DRAFT_260595 [Pterula gracilis]